MTVHLLRTRLRRPTVPRRPYVDGLDNVIAMLTEVREFSIEAHERLAKEHGAENLHPPVFSVPAESIDHILLDLEAARTYRNTLDAYFNAVRDQRRAGHRLLVAAVLLNVGGFLANLLRAVW